MGGLGDGGPGGLPGASAWRISRSAGGRLHTVLFHKGLQIYQ